MAVNLVMLPVNALLAWAWVGGHLGLPALGAVGAAYATAAVSWAGAAAMIALIWTLPRAGERRIRDFGRRRCAARSPACRALAWFGLVPAIGAALELAGFSWLMVLSTQLGNAAAGAFQAMLSIHNLVFALSMGFGSAAGVRVGNAVGAGGRGQAWPRAMIAAGLAVVAARRALAPARAVRRTPWSCPSPTIPRCSLLAASMLGDHGRLPGRSTASNMCSAPPCARWASRSGPGLNGILGFFLVTGGLGWLLVRQGWGPDGLAYAAGVGMLVCALLQFGRLACVLAQEIGPKLKAEGAAAARHVHLGAVERDPPARLELAHRRRDRPGVDHPPLPVLQFGADLRAPAGPRRSGW